MECMQAAYDAGVNFFDNAEAYAGGECEAIMGHVIAELGWPRQSRTCCRRSSSGASTDEPQHENTLNRKYLMQAIDGSLERLGLDYVDLVYCHRADPEHADRGDGVGDERHHRRAARRSTGAPASGRADEIRGAWDIAERHHLHKPVMEQPQYNLFHRERVEHEYARLYDDIGLGTDDLEPAGVRPADRQVPRRHPGGPRGTLKGYDGSPSGSPTRARSPRSSGCGRSPTSSAARSRSCRIAWCAKNPQCRR